MNDHPCFACGCNAVEITPTRQECGACGFTWWRDGKPSVLRRAIAKDSGSHWEPKPLRVSAGRLIQRARSAHVPNLPVRR